MKSFFCLKKYLKKHLNRHMNISCVSESKKIKDLDNICILQKMNM